MRNAMMRRRLVYVVWLAGAALLCFFENNAGTRALLLCSVLLPFLSAVCAAVTAGGLQAALEVPDRCAAGDDVTIRWQLHAPLSLYGCTAEGLIRITNQMTAEQTAIPFRCTGRPRNEDPLCFSPQHCGAYEVFLASVTVRDWFGLYEKAAAPDARAMVCAFPVLFEAGLDSSLCEDLHHENGTITGRKRGHEETAGFRDYQPGDPIRMIHWKLSEKLGRTVLRSTADPQDASILLLLETRRTTQASGRDMHRTVTALLSAAHAMYEAGMPFDAAFADASGQLQLFRAEDATGEPALCQLVLSCSFGEGKESIGTQMSIAYPEMKAASVLLFSAVPDTDAVSALQLGPVTLVLPDELPEHAADPAIRVKVLSPKHPILEL